MVEVYLPNKYVLTPSTCAYNFIQKYCNDLKLKRWVFIRGRKRRFGSRDTVAMWQWCQRLECQEHQAASSHQQPPAATSSQGRGIGWLLSQSFRKESFGFLNLERINLCCFKPPSWWCFVMAALGKQFASNPQIVLGTWSPKIRLHLPAFLAAKYPSSLLPCFSQWDVSSRNMQNLSLYL